MSLEQSKSARAVELQERAWDLQASGDFDAAFLAAEKAVRLLEECEGPGSPDVANLLNDLADIERDRQNFQNALALAKRAREMEDALGNTFTGETAARMRGRTLQLLGTIRCTLGEYARAEVDLGVALELVISQFGEDSAETIAARNNLGMLYKYWGRFEEGLALYERALRTAASVHGEESLACGVIYHNIGGILHAKGEFFAAERPAGKAWEITRAQLGEDDRQTLCDAVAYAGVLDGLERYDESEPIYRRALGIFERTLGPHHYEVAASLHNLAAVLSARGGPDELEEAERMYRRALAIKEQLLGPDNPDAALTRNNLGALLTQQGHFPEAVALLESAVVTLEKRLSPEHSHVALARQNLRDAGAGARRPLRGCEKGRSRGSEAPMAT